MLEQGQEFMGNQTKKKKKKYSTIYLVMGRF